jgi:hypothetical protein
VGSLDIGYVSGRHPSLNRKLQYLRAMVQQAAEPYQLVPIPGPEFGPTLPLIVDLTANSAEADQVVQRLRTITNGPRFLFIHLSDFFGFDEEVRESVHPKAVRNAHHVKLTIEAFVASLPEPYLGERKTISIRTVTYVA